MANPYDDLLRGVALGIEAEAFQKSDIGQYLASRAMDELETARSKLDEADPEDAKLIRSLQNEIWRAKSFLGWLGEAIQNGMNSEEAIRQLESDG